MSRVCIGLLVAAMVSSVVACGSGPAANVSTHPRPSAAPATSSAPAPAPKPPPEKPAITRWPRAGETKAAVRLADAAEAKVVLGKSDGFVAAMGPLDRRARLGVSEEVDSAAFMAHAAAQAKGWPAKSWEKWHRAIHEVGHALEGLKAPLPDEVLFVSSSGEEEFGKPYTRDHAIIIPEDIALNIKRPFALIAHELFHVLSRHATPAERDALYALLGFQRVGVVAHPPAFESQRLTNPDAYTNEHAVKVKAGEESFMVVPLIRSKAPSAEAIGERLMRSLELFLVEVTPDGAHVLVDGKPRIHSVLATNYNELVARNTAYAIHPEEVLADNFALLLERRAGKPEPAADTKLLDALEALLSK